MLSMRIPVAGAGIPMGCNTMVCLDWRHADLDESQQMVLVAGVCGNRKSDGKHVETCPVSQ